MCLEQAAHAFLRIVPAMDRKYALHLILAGHRYAQSAQVSTMKYMYSTSYGMPNTQVCVLDLTQS